MVGAMILHDEMCAAACNYSLSPPPPLLIPKEGVRLLHDLCKLTQMYGVRCCMIGAFWYARLKQKAPLAAVVQQDVDATVASVSPGNIST